VGREEEGAEEVVGGQKKGGRSITMFSWTSFIRAVINCKPMCKSTRLANLSTAKGGHLTCQYHLNWRKTGNFSGEVGADRWHHKSVAAGVARGGN